MGSIIYRAKIDDFEGYLVWIIAQTVGREREWANDPSKTQPPRPASRRPAATSKLFQAMCSQTWMCGEGRSITPRFRFNGTYWQRHKSHATVMTLLSDVIAPKFDVEAAKSALEAQEEEGCRQRQGRG